MDSMREPNKLGLWGSLARKAKGILDEDAAAHKFDDYGKGQTTRKPDSSIGAQVSNEIEMELGPHTFVKHSEYIHSVSKLIVHCLFLGDLHPSLFFSLFQAPQSRWSFDNYGGTERSEPRKRSEALAASVNQFGGRIRNALEVMFFSIMQLYLFCDITKTALNIHFIWALFCVVFWWMTVSIESSVSCWLSPLTCFYVSC
jgi:hypothetical protein